MNYIEKLKNPKWQKKRLLVLERDDFTCQHCGDKKTELHVHHYIYKDNPWDVDDDLLITLCKHCHLIISLMKKNDFEKNIPEIGIKNIVIKEVYDSDIFLLSYTHLEEVMNVSFFKENVSIVFCSKEHINSVNQKIKSD